MRYADGTLEVRRRTTWRINSASMYPKFALSSLLPVGPFAKLYLDCLERALRTPTPEPPFWPPNRSRRFREQAEWVQSVT